MPLLNLKHDQLRTNHHQTKINAQLYTGKVIAQDKCLTHVSVHLEGDGIKRQLIAKNNMLIKHIAQKHFIKSYPHLGKIDNMPFTLFFY